MFEFWHPSLVSRDLLAESIVIWCGGINIVVFDLYVSRSSQFACQYLSVSTVLSYVDASKSYASGSGQYLCVCLPNPTVLLYVNVSVSYVPSSGLFVCVCLSMLIVLSCGVNFDDPFE